MVLRKKILKITNSSLDRINFINKALNIIKEELSMPYVPKKYENILKSLLDELQTKNENKKRKYYSRDEIIDIFVNYDQFCSESSVINENIEEYWIDEIKKSGISEIEYERWLERKKLDREISIGKEIQMLKDVGFRNVECIYLKGKFGVIVSIK